MKLAINVETYTTCLNEGEQCVMCKSWYKSPQPAGRVSISLLPLCSAATQVSEMLEMNKPEHFLLKTEHAQLRELVEFLRESLTAIHIICRDNGYYQSTLL